MMGKRDTAKEFPVKRIARDGIVKFSLSYLNGHYILLGVRKSKPLKKMSGN
jgi:hypothetical protein